jgi:tRNA nucleotidyltransferase (CCA-adding enzyme)
MDTLPPHISTILSRLEDRGFAAYLVGGCIRDSLRGITPHDWDIATSAQPDEVRTVFAGEKFYDIGLAHGTIALSTVEGIVELTTFRTEGDYKDRRHPSEVNFVDTIEEDLARRDFTMNALAYNPSRGYIDPFNGRFAIQEEIISAVGDPDTRLEEDALRIMRALRFSATLGFTIDPALAESLHKNRELLRAIAVERVIRELLQLLCGNAALPVLLAYPDVLSVVLPEIHDTIGHDQRSPYHCFDIWEHTARSIAESKNDPLVRLTLLLHDLGKPATFFTDEQGRGHFYGHDKVGEQIARDRLKALRFDTKTIDQVALAIRYHQVAFKPETMRKWLSRLGEPLVRLLIEVKRGDIAAHVPSVVSSSLASLDVAEKTVDELIAQEACFSLKDLALDGKDLKALGIEEGPKIGRVLNALLDAVVEDELDNTPEALSNKAKEL